MTLRFLALLLCISSSAAAGSIKLVWDGSPSTNVNYVVQAYNVTRGTNQFFSVGTNLAATIEANGEQWNFMVIAEKDGAESPSSNVLPIEFPKPPANLRAVPILYTHDLTSTQWQSGGNIFIKLNP